MLSELILKPLGRPRRNQTKYCMCLNNFTEEKEVQFELIEGKWRIGRGRGGGRSLGEGD